MHWPQMLQCTKVETLDFTRQKSDSLSISLLFSVPLMRTCTHHLIWIPPSLSSQSWGEKERQGHVMNIEVDINCHNGTSTLTFSFSHLSFLRGHSALGSPTKQYLLTWLWHHHPYILCLTLMICADMQGKSKSDAMKRRISREIALGN